MLSQSEGYLIRRLRAQPRGGRQADGRVGEQMYILLRHLCISRFGSQLRRNQVSRRKTRLPVMIELFLNGKTRPVQPDIGVQAFGQFDVIFRVCGVFIRFALIAAVILILLRVAYGHDAGVERMVDGIGAKTYIMVG